MKLNESFQSVSRMFSGHFKGVSRKIVGVLMYLKEVQMVFQGGFREVLRKLQECLKKV